MLHVTGPKEGSQRRRDLTCQELVELVTDYLDGAQPEAEHTRFDAHVSACEGRELYVEQMRTTVTLTQRARDLEERPDVSALLRAFRDYRRS